MMEEEITDNNRLNEDVNATIQVTTTVSSEEDNLLNPPVETVDTVEISSEDPGTETSGWSIIWVIFFVIILIVILVLLISVFTFAMKNYLFHCFSRDEGTYLTTYLTFETLNWQSDKLFYGISSYFLFPILLLMYAFPPILTSVITNNEIK